MRRKNLTLAIVLIVVGLVMTVAAHLLTSMRQTPTITEQDFAYAVTYKLDGEIKTVDGVYTCRFDGFGNNGIDPLDRYYSGDYTIDGDTTLSRRHTIAQKDGLELYIVALFDDSYLMGDTKAPSLSEPYLEAVDQEGNQYDEEDMPDTFDAEILGWDYPEPIENTFVFAGFSGLHGNSMLTMVLVGLLTLVLCVVLVKKDDGVVYGMLDKVGVVLNVVAAVVALPILSLAACMIQAYPTAPDWIYQVYLYIPPIIPFTLAASVSLRRNGMSKSGFFVQFIGFAMFLAFGILEYIL